MFRPLVILSLVLSTALAGITIAAAPAAASHSSCPGATSTSPTINTVSPGVSRTVLVNGNFAVRSIEGWIRVTAWKLIDCSAHVCFNDRLLTDLQGVSCSNNAQVVVQVRYYTGSGSVPAVFMVGPI